MISLLLAWQLAPAPAGQGMLETEFDLRRAETAASTGDTIVVVGTRLTNQRLIPLPSVEDRILPRAEFRPFGDAHLGLEVEQGAVANATTNRVMLKLKMPF